MYVAHAVVSIHLVSERFGVGFLIEVLSNFLCHLLFKCRLNFQILFCTIVLSLQIQVYDITHMSVRVNCSPVYIGAAIFTFNCLRMNVALALLYPFLSWLLEAKESLVGLLSDTFSALHLIH